MSNNISSENKKLLTICVPTYNREKLVEKQLMFFRAQNNNNSEILKNVNFIVRDNCSKDRTALRLKKIQKTDNFFEYVINNENVGLIGNVQLLLGDVNTEYVWFISDDDILEMNIIDYVLDIIIANKSVEYFFLNFHIAKRLGYSGKLSKDQKDSKRAALEIFRNGYGSLLLLTSSVYKTSNLVEIKDHKFSSLLSAPLFYSFYSCMKGDIYISNKVYIRFREGNASYSGIIRVTKLKFEEYLSILNYLKEIGYSYDDVDLTIKYFLISQTNAHLIYTLISPLKSLKLYKYYSVKDFLSIIINTYNYIFK